jgi:hypothetical protein
MEKQEWKAGDLVINDQHQSALVLSVERLLEEWENTEAFLIADDGQFIRVYPYQPQHSWSRVRDTGMEYEYETRDQVLADFRKGYFNPYLA